ncbi:enolase C-terminal domain-like protein [Aureimonas frigidaquae]|uniref:enolase C-terminal domain-like protein n=1 Tax=Aureimonas frigidaquae TaxID=424757 RepID=UPI000AC289F5|nr:enolase C-terminal domain-like protein [Aureimonas frigidaquae]
MTMLKGAASGQGASGRDENAAGAPTRSAARGGRITRLDVTDLRFPTSRQLDGSDAMNPAPDYSAAYVILELENGLTGHGLSFTIGRGNEIVVAAVRSLSALVVGVEFSTITANMGAFWKSLTGDSQLRWIGPDKGAVHLAAAAIVNALWDLWAKQEGKPVWKLVADMTPEELVACLDFTFVTDVLSPDEALRMLQAQAAGKAERVRLLEEKGFPAYTTAAGWLGYDDDKIRRLIREARAEGFEAFKQKVGASVEDDLRRGRIFREELGPDRVLMLDANQIWEVPVAIEAMGRLAELDPYWIEEPTSPDDILGHKAIRDAIAPIRVATGEQVQNRIMFKQMFAAGALDVCQLDVARLGGLNEALLVMLMAAKFDIPVCPHGGGVGLCEYIQHLSFIDFIAISGDSEGRFIEHVAHLHEHFENPITMRNGRFMLPAAPGFSIEIKPASLAEHRFPDGPVWQS